MKAGELVGLSALLVVVPFLLVVATSFLRFAVVLAILRRAFGGSILPPASVAAALALLGALFVTAPVGEKVLAEVGPALARGDTAALAQASERAALPVKAFLQKHSPERDQKSALELQRRLRPVEARDQVKADDLVVLLYAFAGAELKAAFQIGFLLFLPFLVLELLCALVMLGLGIHSLHAATVALPFKLLLFIAVDGWHLLLRGLVLGYT